MTIDWHYPRKDLTEKVLIAYDQGLSDTLTLFAPRRMGKTEFVLLDLIPAAAQRGYTPVYVSFWENKDDPTSSLLAAINVALEGSSWWKRTTKKIASARLSVHANAAGEFGGSLDVSKAAGSANDPDTLRALKEALSTLAAKHDRILLCLDEAQHLATRPEFENLVFFLRTFLDQNRKRVRVMYTGSSRDGLRKLFNKRKAALFQSSSQIDLPQLGSGFVEHMRQCYKQATSQDFSLRDGLIAFSTLNYVPREFRSVLEKMILSGSSDIINEAAVARDEQVEDSNYPATWNTLKSIDQAILTWIAHGGTGLYQEACKDYIAGHLGIDPDQVETHHIQNAVNRLRGEHLSLVSHGNYEFEDARFQEWIQVTTDAPPLT